MVAGLLAWTRGSGNCTATCSVGGTEVPTIVSFTALVVLFEIDKPSCDSDTSGWTDVHEAVVQLRFRLGLTPLVDVPPPS